MTSLDLIPWPCHLLIGLDSTLIATSCSEGCGGVAAHSLPNTVTFDGNRFERATISMAQLQARPVYTSHKIYFALIVAPH